MDYGVLCDIAINELMSSGKFDINQQKMLQKVFDFCFDLSKDRQDMYEYREKIRKFISKL